MWFVIFAQLALSAEGEWRPNAAEQKIYHALSVRHPVPSCESLESIISDEGATLLSVIAHAKQPAWVGIRAGQCVIVGHSAAREAELVRWVSDPQWRGLGQMVIAHLDQLPEKVSLSVARAALSGPLVERAHVELAQSSRVELRALVSSR